MSEQVSRSSCVCKGTEPWVLSMNIYPTFESRTPLFYLPGSISIYDKSRVIFLREVLGGTFSHR